MCTFKMARNSGIALKVGLFQSDFTFTYCVQGQVYTLKYLNHLDRFFFKRVGIALRLVFSLKLAIPELILTSTNQNVGVSLQYLHPYLPLPTGILGHNCNLALVLTFTNWDFGAQLQYLHLTLILSLSFCFYISHFLCLLLGNNNNLCAILDFMCVLNT